MFSHTGWIGPVLAVLIGLQAQAADPEPLQTLFLSPAQYETRVGETLIVRARAGLGAAAQGVPWKSERVDWFFVRAAGTQKNIPFEQIDRVPGQDDAVSVAIQHAGVTLLGLDTRPDVANVAGRELHAFLRNRVAPATTSGVPKPARNRTVRLRRIESAKTLVRADGRAGPSATAQSKTGQAVEIRALADPTTVQTGSDLPIRVYVNGSKKAGARVIATHVESGMTQEMTTDRVGAAHFRIQQAGVWALEFHHAEPLDADRDADWVLYSATLTFKTPAADGGG